MIIFDIIQCLTLYIVSNWHNVVSNLTIVLIKNNDSSLVGAVATHVRLNLTL